MSFNSVVVSLLYILPTLTQDLHFIVQRKISKNVKDRGHLSDDPRAQVSGLKHTLIKVNVVECIP